MWGSWNGRLGETVRRQPHKIYHRSPFQSSALKTQGKLNTRPGKVGSGGQMGGAAGGGGSVDRA